MKLYKLKQETPFKLGEMSLLFHNMDYGYAHCTNGYGQVIYVEGWAEVEITDGPD